MAFEAKVELVSDHEEEEEAQKQAQNDEMGVNDIRLFLIRRTLMQMLRDRGYLIGDMEIAMSKEDFREKFGKEVKRQSLDMVKWKRSDPTKQVLVLFPEEVKVGVAVMKRYAEMMKEQKIKLAILVVQRNLTLQGKQSVQEMSGLYRIEVFQETELLVNIRESVLVPEHHILTADERKRILERYSSNSGQIPRMLVDDPVARYYGLRKGQMVKIVRPDQPAAGASVSYRVVM